MILKRYLNLANAKELVLKDPLGFIKEFIKASVIQFPFQNITSFGAFLPLERATPGFKEILKATAKGEGGLCGHLNNYMKLQLDSLGYQTELIAGCFRRTGIPLSHYLVKVKIPSHLTKESKKGIAGGVAKDKCYLVDVGCGIPLTDPLCLDSLPYRGRAGGLNFRYERIDSETVQRVNECGDAIIGRKQEDFQSPQDYTINLTPRQYTDFKEPVCAVYRNPRSVYLHQGMYLFRYLDIGENDFEIVCIRGTDLIFITLEGRHVQSFKSYADIEPYIFKYFPMIDKEEVKLAVKHFSIPFEEALKMRSA